MGIHVPLARMPTPTRLPARIRSESARVLCIQEDLQSLLQKAHKKTFEHEPGQLYGRAGRRCTLEDGERILERCSRLYPDSLEARLMMAHNLSRQNRGREREVPGLALQALALDSLQTCKAGSAVAESALELIQLGFDALRRSELVSPNKIQYVEEAKRLVPQLADKIDELASF